MQGMRKHGEKAKGRQSLLRPGRFCPKFDSKNGNFQDFTDHNTHNIGNFASLSRRNAVAW